jgi:PKD repeat protein
VLPKPKKQMIGKHIIYYLQATGRDLAQVTSEETDPRVVAKKEDCQNEPVAGFASHPPAAVFPNVPAGFAVGGAVAPAVVGTTLAAGAGTGVVLATRGGNEPAPAPPTTPPPVTPPAPPPVTPTPPAEPTPTPLQVACRATPSTGGAPLTVEFRASASGATGAYEFRWVFGDGATANRPNPSHTYENPGRYSAVLSVSSGDETAACETAIKVEKNCTFLAGPTTAITSPSGGTVSGTVSVQASATSGSNITNVEFYATVGSRGGAPTLIGSDNTAPFAVNWTVPAGCEDAQLFSRAFDSCVRQADSAPVSVTLNNDSAPPTVDITSPQEGEIIPMGGPNAIDVAADASDPAGIRDVLFEANQPSSCSKGAPFLDSQTDDTAPYTASLNVDAAEGCCACVRLTATGTDICGNATSVERNVFADFDGCCILGIAAVRRPQLRHSPEQAPDSATGWVSHLEVADASGQVVLNRGRLMMATTGISRQSAALRHGENRIDAQLVRGTGKPGVWRFDLGATEGFEPGSLRVLEGEVALLTDRIVVFRLKGQAGERVAFSFGVK